MISVETEVVERATAAPQVTVIIPTYNSAAYLAASLDSVLAQTFRDFEVIVIDDGSTDDTAAVLAPYGERVTYLRQPNGGPASARNLGIRRARGEFIAFQDADDLWLPDKLELQLAYFKQHPDVGVVFTDGARFDAEGNFTRSFRETHGYIPGDKMFETLLSTHFIAMPTVMVRRSCLDDIGGFDEALRGAEDYNLYLRLARKYPFGFLDKVLVHVRSHGRSLSENLEQMCKDEIQNLEKVCRMFPDAAIPRRRLTGQIYARFGRYYFSQQRFAEARECFKKAFRHMPFLVRAYPFFALAAIPEALRTPLLSLNKSVKRVRI